MSRFLYSLGGAAGAGAVGSFIAAAWTHGSTQGSWVGTGSALMFAAIIATTAASISDI